MAERRAFSYLLALKTEFGVARELDTSDLHVEVIDPLGNRVEAEFGVPHFFAASSILRKPSPQAGLLVLGDTRVQGNIKAIRSLTEPLQVAMDHRAMRVPAPIENQRRFLDVNAEVLEAVAPISCADERQAAFIALAPS